MSISLATHIKTSRHGIFYFRMSVPVPLRQVMGKSELLYSLHTRDPAKAKRLAYTLTSQTHALFEKMAYDPHKFNPNDLSTFPTSADSGSLRPYELEMGMSGAIKIKSDSAEDHARAMEALAMMKSLPQAPAPAPQPHYIREPQPEQTITISKALVSWAATLTNTKTRKNFTSFVNRFIALNGDVEVHKIRGMDVVTWKAELLKTLAPVTVDTRLQALQSLLTWCLLHNYLSDIKPLVTKGKFAVVDKEEREKQTKGAERFRIEDLNKIFNPSAYAIYTTKNTGLKSDARHWIPLVGLFTGMRLEEIGQLTKDDIKNIGGVDIIDVNRNGGKKLKTAASVRAIPIHQTLLDMGFLEYVKGLESKSLWPELKRTANGYGNPVSKAFIRHLEKIGVRKDKDRAMVFHSLRDTFNNICEVSIGVTPEVRYTLMGHEQGGSNEKNYLEPKTLQRLKHDGIDLLVYAETVAGVTHQLVL